MAHEA